MQLILQRNLGKEPSGLFIWLMTVNKNLLQLKWYFFIFFEVENLLFEFRSAKKNLDVKKLKNSLNKNFIYTEEQLIKIF